MNLSIDVAIGAGEGRSMFEGGATQQVTEAADEEGP